MLRAFAKALVPLIGFTWVFFTEFLSPNGASSIACQDCLANGGDVDLWSEKEAIAYHLERLSQNLAAAQPGST